jgi:hypothetical protein
MANKGKNRFIVFFSWAKLNRSQANRVGFTLICGFIAAIVLVLTIGDTRPVLAKASVISVAAIAFLLYGRHRNSK